MRQYRITKELIKTVNINKLDDILMHELDSGIIISKNKSNEIVYMNSPAVEFFAKDILNDNHVYIEEFFDEKEIELISCGKSFTIERKNKTLEIFSNSSDGFNLLVINDITRLVTIEEEIVTLKKLNRNLQSVYEQYSDDTICIADSNGIVEFAGEACYRHCGITADDIVGMNMYDLEKEQYFYPAATTKVLQSGKNEVVMSDTKIGVTLITIGVPIFNEAGQIKKVISISRDFSKEVEIATLLAQIKVDVYETGDSIEANKMIVTCSNKMYSIMTLVRLVAKTDSTILLEGDTGTGKGVFARYIHNKSDRAKKPFVVVNCGSIAENVIESELFGYEAGTFTGGSKEGKIGLLELAQEGTLFLDEISELPLSQQVKLLNVLQDKTMLRVGGRKYINLDFRVIAATNKDLEDMVEKGTFREDLFYRLNVVNVKIPPLEERKEDIPLLIKHFLKKMNELNGTHKEISEDAISKLSQYSWPGNVRELENMLEMLSITTQDNVIDTKHLPNKVKMESKSKLIKEDLIEVKGTMNLRQALSDTEKKLIALAFNETGGNHQKIANILGVDRSTITRKINQYNIISK